LRLAVLVSLMAMLAGCGSKDRPVAVSLPPTPVPNYGLGDSYQFSDGSKETVTAVDGKVVRWRGNNGTYVTSREVLLPRLAWSDSGSQGERNIAGDTVALFPLEAGKSVSFTARRSSRTGPGGRRVTVKEDWECEVAGASRVPTTAGQFDTWRVDCLMREQPAVTGDGPIRRSFYYAPDIGYYARLEEAVGDGPLQVAQLTSYTTADPALPDTALRQRSIELQRALEGEVSGGRTTWTDANANATGDVILVETRRSAQYGWCRDFAEHIHWAGRTYALQGTGCRDEGKVWDIVALAPGKIGSN